MELKNKSFQLSSSIDGKEKKKPTHKAVSPWNFKTALIKRRLEVSREAERVTCETLGISVERHWPLNSNTGGNCPMLSKFGGKGGMKTFFRTLKIPKFLSRTGQHKKGILRKAMGEPKQSKPSISWKWQWEPFRIFRVTRPAGTR